MKPGNLVIIMSDEHNPKVMGCNGHPIVKTPNIDALAAGGTMFTSAYTTCPVCVPARAAFAVGKYVHQIGYWDNADAYEGAIPSWHHRLREPRPPRGVDRQAAFPRPRGRRQRFFEEIIPMNIVEGKGDLMGLVRNDLPERGAGVEDRQARRSRRDVVYVLRPRDRDARRRSGCARKRRSTATSRGCCSCRSCARISR